MLFSNRLHAPRRRRLALLFGIAVAQFSVQMVASAPAMARQSSSRDSCSELREPFSRIRNYRRDEAIKGAVVGALGGLLLGVVNNARQSEGNRDSVLPFLAAGAAAGGIAGYVSSQAEGARSREELQQAIATDFGRDLGQFNPLTDALSALGECRRGQIAMLEADIAAGELNQRNADRQLRRIEGWIERDDRTIELAAGIQVDTVTTFAQANAIAEGHDPELVQTEGWAQQYYSNDAAYYTAADSQTAQSSAPVSIGLAYVTAVSGANLRDGPSTSNSVLQTLASGSPVTIIEEGLSGEWSYIRLADNSAQGYISSSLLGDAPPQRSAALRSVARNEPQAARQPVARAIAESHNFERARARERSATSTRLAAARQLLAGA